MIKLTADNVKALDGVMAIWWCEHQGDGHGPATRAQSLAGRRRNEYYGLPLEVILPDEDGA
jgi:hypothetical protein